METEDWSFAVIDGLQSEIKRLREALERIDNMAPATQEVTLASMMADEARAALNPEP